MLKALDTRESCAVWQQPGPADLLEYMCSGRRWACFTSLLPGSTALLTRPGHPSLQQDQSSCRNFKNLTHRFTSPHVCQHNGTLTGCMMTTGPLSLIKFNTEELSILRASGTATILVAEAMTFASDFPWEPVNVTFKSQLTGAAGTLLMHHTLVGLHVHLCVWCKSRQ